MKKEYKIGIGIVLSASIIALFIRIYTQKGGFSGLTIANKSKALQDIFATFRSNNAPVTTSDYNAEIGYVDYSHKSPYGIILSRFQDDGKLIIIKTYNNETYNGTWSSDGKLNVQNVGLINEGNIYNSTVALSAMLT
jgi:hypothetical protein